jgi:hypothetical protein
MDTGNGITQTQTGNNKFKLEALLVHLSDEKILLYFGFNIGHLAMVMPGRGECE